MIPYIAFGLFFLVGLIVGLSVGAAICDMAPTSDEMEYIPFPEKKEGKEKKKEVIFAEPVSPEEAFKQSNSIDALIKKISVKHE